MITYGTLRTLDLTQVHKGFSLFLLYFCSALVSGLVSLYVPVWSEVLCRDSGGVSAPLASGHRVVNPVGEREILLRPPHPGGGPLLDPLGVQVVGVATLLMVLAARGTGSSDNVGVRTA